MKLYTGLIILVSLCLFSCEKWLNQAPTGEVTKEYIFEDWTRSLRYINTLYSNRINDWATGARISDGRGGFLESATDMAEYTANYGIANVSFNIGNWYQSDAQSDEVNRWGNSYSNLRRCYMFFENMHLFDNDDPDYLGDGVRRKVLMKGEVHFMIAWYYNELLKRYGGVPIVTKTLEFDSDFRIPRATYDETLDFILAHLDTAQTILPDEWPSDDHGRITKPVIMAFRSRLLLYAASPLNNPDNSQDKWIAAANAARDLIDYVEDPASVGYEMYSLEPHWQRIFMRANYPEEVPEIIDMKKRSSYTYDFTDELIQNNCATPGDPFQGYGSNGPTQNFVDRFEKLVKDAGGVVIGTEKFDWDNPDHVGVNGNNLYKDRDPRFYYTVLYNDQNWIHRKLEMWRDGTNYGRDLNPKDHLYTHTGYYLKKFWPRELRQRVGTTGNANMTGFYQRLAEIYLNYAEAMNEAYGPDADLLGRTTGTFTAREAVNKIRARVVCPAFASAPAINHPFYQVWLERLDSPYFPTLPDGIPPIPDTEDVTTETFRERVRNERVVELAFEDHYWYDILRWKLGEEHIGGTIYGIDIIKAGEEFIYRRVKVEDRYFDPVRMYRYPIPQQEVNVMEIEQNPGW
ncbi:MAG: RagB/SusD family nutrient uptake outer membrane protein [Bacteroidales bacterium]|nr:RagB/SusD family nutrient uptake outer membrane protein [Bacteroidales bacterium]